MTDTVPNLRDLGGTDVEGGSIRPGRLLRSALPLRDDVAPPEIVWPPAVVIDLRSVAEVEPEHPLAGPDVTVHNFPLLSALRPGVAPPESLAELYQLMLQTTARHLVEVVDAVAAADATTLVHCAAGKDRTGVSIAMVLALLGAKRDDIVDDYLVTAQNEEQIQARFARLYGERRAALPAGYIATPVEAISGVLDTWDEYPGGAVAWFHRWGGRPETIDRLRTTLVR
ncbi:protein-tyrosine-phosphatase [Aeromicrobium flavum]|uniref:Protein-tyrosine-phosphatase n=1 Tax=Aeromicrobium flavum TaxID=416568 RepID=A0A512HWN6_9ACTN|nr:tyrosine-protein phosphatase [Aeromicrobium flavum]GEO89845.1 protein-tyrosine-phosphatase [Aeromicrobium flavum]